MLEHHKIIPRIRLLWIMTERKDFVWHHIESELFHLRLVRAGENNFSIWICLEQSIHFRENTFIFYDESIDRIDENCFHTWGKMSAEYMSYLG